MAFRNIFWEAKDHFALKTGLPKLLTGIIMVPFTWFIVSGVLSIANYVTAETLRLPASIAKTDQENKLLKEMWIPMDVVVDLKVNYGTGKVDASWSSTSDKDKNYQANGNTYAPDCTIEANRTAWEPGASAKCKNLKSILTDGGGWSFNMLIPYAYNVFEIQKIKLINKESITDGIVVKIWDVVQQLFFGAFFYAAFGVICIALVAALFTRAIYMWLYAIFSPLFALEYFFAGKMPGGDAMKAFKFNTFIWLAFVPVIVAAWLSFWLLFISAVQQLNVQGTNGTAKGVCEWTNCTLEIGGFKLTTKWLIWDNKPSPDSKPVNILDPSKSLIGKVIVNVIALMLLWMIVKAALASSEITKKITDPIFKFGETIAKSTPIPIPGLGKMPLGHAGWLLTQATSAIESAAASEGMKYGRKFGEWIAGWMGYTTDEMSKSVAINRIKAKTIPVTDKKGQWEFLTKTITEGRFDAQDLATNVALKREWVWTLRDMWLEDMAKKFESANNATQMWEALSGLDKALDGWLLSSQIRGTEAIMQEMKDIKAGGKVAAEWESIKLSADEIKDYRAWATQVWKIHINVDAATGKVTHVNADGLGGTFTLNPTFVSNPIAGSLTPEDTKHLSGLLASLTSDQQKDVLGKQFKVATGNNMEEVLEKLWFGKPKSTPVTPPIPPKPTPKP